MKNTLFRVIILLASLILVLILILLLIFNLQNLKTKSASIKNELESRRSRLERVRPTDQINRDTEGIAQGLKKFDIFVNPQEELDLITKLEGLASQYQLKQKLKLDVKNKKAAPFGGEIIPVSITLSGDYLDGLRYLQDLEKLDSQINVIRLNIINLNTETEKKGVEINLLAQAHSFKL